eukprot:GHVO01027641.1.p1 GENE.GHVO01027641.1~~GHVO01027641.1.p1  ORF type:complete len:704 (-),score=143.25 GHVO01027641.1:184-2274(-)
MKHRPSAKSKQPKQKKAENPSPAKGGLSSTKIKKHQTKKERSCAKKDVRRQTAKLRKSEEAKTQSLPKVIVVVPFSEDIDGLKFTQEIIAACGGAPGTGLPTCPGTVHLPMGYSGKAQRAEIFVSPREVLGCVDALKCADIMIALMSGSDLERPPFDQVGYSMLSAARVQGLPQVIGARWSPLDGEDIQKHKYTQRYFSSEFGNDKRFFGITTPDSLTTLLKHVSDMQRKPMAIQKDRGYMIASGVEYDAASNMLAVVGYTRGHGFSTKYPVHITGVGDTYVHQIKSIPEPCPPPKQGGEEMAVPVADVLQEVSEEEQLRLVEAFQNRIRPFDPSKQIISLADTTMGVDSASDNFEEIADSDCGLSDEELPVFGEDTKSEFNPSRIDIEERAQDDLEFPDEVDTPTDQYAFERFRTYKSMKSFATSVWDPNTNLPDEYSRIYQYESVGAEVKQSKAEFLAHADERGVPGRYVCLYLRGVTPEMAGKIVPHRPIVVSTLFFFELQVSVSHFSVSRHDEYDHPIPSKSLMDLHCGFRRMEIRPLFSECPFKSMSTKHQKYTYLRKLEKREGRHLSSAALSASAYMPTCAPGTPVSLYLLSPHVPKMGLAPPETSYRISAWGSASAPCPSRVIIKRILLTGNFYKVHKKKAVIRYMFFNPRDVRYFRSVELRTKKGARGRIKCSLGTHGLMKCVFNQKN